MADRILHASEIIQVAPVDCDSTVSYRIVTDDDWFFATVQIADCNRKIDWGFNDSDVSVKKVDATIAFLKRFRAAFIAARKQHTKCKAALADSAKPVS